MSEEGPVFASNVDSICVGPDDDLKTVLAVLQNSRLRICLVINSDRKVLGTITDGDCRRALLSTTSLGLKAEEIMNPQFVMVDSNFPLDQVHSLMATNSIRQVPVVDSSLRLVNLISSPDNGPWERNTRVGCVALILAGGKGQRLRPLTNYVPKPLLPVGGRPMVERLIAGLVNNGVTTIYIAINYLGEQIRSHFRDGAEFGCRIEYLEEDTELGTAGPLNLLPADIEGPIIVVNGDLVTSVDFRAFLDFHVNRGHDLTMGISTHMVEVPFGVVNLDVDGKVTSIQEKPVLNYQVNAGLYAVDMTLRQLVPSGQLYPMTDLISTAIQQGKSIGGFPIHESWIDVGRPEQYFTAQKNT